MSAFDARRASCRALNAIPRARDCGPSVCHLSESGRRDDRVRRARRARRRSTRAGARRVGKIFSHRARAFDRARRLRRRGAERRRARPRARRRTGARVAERRDDTHMPPQSDDVSASMVIGYFYVMHA